MPNLKNVVGVNRVYDTYYSYLLTYKHLSNFIRMKYNSEDVPLVSLTHKFINDFDFYLRVEKTDAGKHRF